MVWDGANPTRLIVKWPEGAPRQRALSREEIERLLVTCQASTWPKLRLLVLLAITTGMRRGNLENLRHCDFNGNRIGPVTTKNGSQFIGVLIPEAGAELSRFLEPGSTQLMFEGLPGKPFLFNNALEKAFKAAGLTDVVFHTFRHTAASMAATGGASTLQIMDLTNHKTPAMAARYSHLNVTAPGEAGGCGVRGCAVSHVGWLYKITPHTQHPCTQIQQPCVSARYGTLCA